VPTLNTGCQPTTGSETLPSAYYGGRDDVQYYQHGPEFKLSNQVEAIEEYKLGQLQQSVSTAEGGVE
jgi:hypothetical protein